MPTMCLGCWALEIHWGWVVFAPEELMVTWKRQIHVFQLATGTNRSINSNPLELEGEAWVHQLLRYTPICGLICGLYPLTGIG